MKCKFDAEYTIQGRAVLISDLHLTPGSSHAEQTLQRFLHSKLGGVQRLFILGDLFEFWIGAKHEANGEFARVIEMLRSVVAGGIPISILQGNRDFHMGAEITRAIGADVYEEGIVLNANGRRLYVCHGDTFCTRDIGYQRTRAILRNPIARRVYRLMPTLVAHFLADGFRQMSQRTVSNKVNGSASIVLDAVEQVLDRGYDAVICGHVHTPRHVTLLRDDGEKTLVVLGDWSRHGWYAEVEGDRLELLRFD